jgi:hypothetical protein
VDESRGTGTAPLASRAPNHIVAARAQESSVALSQLKELGEQAIVAVQRVSRAAAQLLEASS